MTRDDLYNYYRQRYIPNNATLVLVGDFDTADLMKQVETHFGPLASGESITGPIDDRTGAARRKTGHGSEGRNARLCRHRLPHPRGGTS